jgi:deazaflavin-dependent oxidoreductase (nitroreductase family)
MSSLRQPSPSVEDARGAATVSARRASVAHRAARAGTRVFNPLAARFAGNRVFPIYALVRHRGRRSGRAYATPVAARPAPGGFIIPLSFGTKADWFQNVQAAGECVVRWKGAEHALVDPRVVDWSEAQVAFNPLEGALMSLAGIRRFVRLRDDPSAP